MERQLTQLLPTDDKILSSYGISSEYSFFQNNVFFCVNVYISYEKTVAMMKISNLS